MVSAGFEPAHPKIIELESIALDHSAKTPLQYESKYFQRPSTSPGRESNPFCFNQKLKGLFVLQYSYLISSPSGGRTHDLRVISTAP